MPTGVTETIWHFAGYLHLIDEVSRSWTLYEDEPATPVSEELPQGETRAPQAPEPEPTFSLPSPFWAGAAQPIGAEPLLLLRGPQSVDPDRAEVGPFDIPVRDLAAPATGAGGVVNVSVGFRARVEREDAFGETVAEIRQVNQLHDSDTFVWGTDLASGLLPVDPVAAMAALLDAVRDAVPDALVAPVGQDEIGATLVARAEALAAGEGDGALADYAMTAGRWVDGEQVDADWELPPFEGVPEMPEGKNGHEAYGAHAHLGANTATNLAMVQDLNEISLQTIVHGDYYKLNAIVQINAIMDIDAVMIFGAQMAGMSDTLAWGGGSADEAWCGGNRLTNIAEYVRHDVHFGAAELPSLGGLHWTVDVLDGDFWDIKAVYQTNWIVDDDVYSKTVYDFFSQVRMGDNLSINLTDFLQAAGDYDLIVIGGNHYSANWIVQANVLLDSDGVLVGHLGGAGVQDGATGQNQLTNDALIALYGGGGFQALDGDLAAFVQRLLTEDAVDPAEWWSLNGIGSGAMRVLYVTGDYHDVNLVSQLNVVSDADALAQVLPADAIHGDGEDGTEQWVATGGNVLTNTAIIVDSEAAVATHVGGEIYEEDFLVQAEIVIDCDDDDDLGLAPELVAFTGCEETAADEDGAIAGTSLAGQGDLMGSMMT